MSINGLRIHSSVSRESWLLKKYDNNTQDKHAFNNDIDSARALNTQNITNYYWNLSESVKHAPHSVSTESSAGTTPTSLDNDLADIAKSLSRLIKDWRQFSSLAGSSYRIDNVVSSLLVLIRDSLFSYVHNIFRDSNLRGVHGFCISSSLDFNLHDFFIKFLQKAFWLPRRHPKSNQERDGPGSTDSDLIFTLNLGEHSGTDPNLCYANRCYLATCCCQRCTLVLEYLDKNHNDTLSSENLEKLVLNEHFYLKEFFLHNDRYQTLEYKLLKITLSGLILKRRQYRDLHSLVGGDSGLRQLFRSCFVLIRDFELLDVPPSDDETNSLNLASLLTDLLMEYTDLWEKLDLPIFSFLFFKNEPTTMPNDPIIYESTLPTPNLLSLFEGSTHLQYFTHLSDEVINENSKLEYFKDLLRGGISWDESHHQDTLRRLLRLTRGYTLDDLKVLTRLATFASSKDGLLDLSKDPVKYFEKAVSMKSLPDFTGLGIQPEMVTVTNPLKFTPLKKLKGQVVPKIGLESMVLPDHTLEQIGIFLSQWLNPEADNRNYSVGLVIKGDSGTGKTSLAHSLAQEMDAILFPLNLVNFIRPEVGASEKLLHSFISSLKSHFSGSKSGARRDLVKCVVLLEGLEALRGTEGYLKRFVSALCSEIDDLRARCLFNLDSSILFVTTCQNYSDLPDKLASKFTEKLEITNRQMDEWLVRNCFELFLNLRCDSLDRMDELVTHTREKNYLKALTPLKIATIVKEAALLTVNSLSDAHKERTYTTDERADSNLVSLKTVISVMDSTLM